MCIRIWTVSIWFRTVLFCFHTDITTSESNCPPQLLMDGTHFTTIGYTLVGKLVYQRGVSLGYW